MKNFIPVFVAVMMLLPFIPLSAEDTEEIVMEEITDEPVKEKEKPADQKKDTKKDMQQKDRMLKCSFAS